MVREEVPARERVSIETSQAQNTGAISFRSKYPYRGTHSIQRGVGNRPSVVIENQ